MLQVAFAKSHGAVYLHGQARLQVLEGQISILGRNISSTDGSFDIFSPKCNALLSLECVSDTALILFSSISENGLSAVDGVQTYFANMFVPDPSLLSEGLEEVVIGCFIVRNFGNFEHFHPLLVSDAWKAAAASLSEVESPVVLVCGQRKVGKSTFARFISNTLLNENDSVDFVDLDPGQTEFTTAGFLVRKELGRPGQFGPPFTHLSLPDDSVFLACSSPVEMPGLYCQAVDALAKRLQVSLQERSRPVVVNTMGWMTGLGFEFLLFAAKSFRVTHIFCFNDPEFTDDGNDAIIKALSASSGIRNIQISALTEAEAASVKLIYMPANLGDLPKAKFHPSDWRNLAYWCYFFGRFNANLSIDSFAFSQLSHLKPVAVPLRRLQLASSDRDIDLFDLIGKGRLERLRSLLLMRLVGLVVDEEFTPTRSLNLLPGGQYNRIASMKALGVGIVRSVTVIRRDGEFEFSLQIITPIPFEIVKTSNTLVMGSLALPPQLISGDQISAQAEAPFFSIQNHSDSIGSAVRTNRPNVLRRRE
jgi:hypothetical protein